MPRKLFLSCLPAFLISFVSSNRICREKLAGQGTLTETKNTGEKCFQPKKPSLTANPPTESCKVVPYIPCIITHIVSTSWKMVGGLAVTVTFLLAFCQRIQADSE
jgi:hypothetical protein